jgi:hypothetical protein
MCYDEFWKMAHQIAYRVYRGFDDDEVAAACKTADAREE